MGVKGLFPLVKKHLPTYKMKVPASMYEGKIIAVDTYNFLYILLSSAQKLVVNRMKQSKSILEDVDRSQLMTELIRMLIWKACFFLNNGILPIFVIDGTSKRKLNENNGIDHASEINVTKQLAWDKRSKAK